MLDPSSLLLLLSCKQQRIKTRILASQKTDFPQLVIFHLSLGKSSRNRDSKKKTHLIWKIGASIILFSLYSSGWIEKNV
jgi:hypothetical protein